MAKLALFPILLAAGCVVAGAYGVLHNQISYTVSPDYFFAFKFHQFDIPSNLQGRVGAMHNFSYAGGQLGILTASAYLFVARLRQIKRRRPETHRTCSTE